MVAALTIKGKREPMEQRPDQCGDRPVGATTTNASHKLSQKTTTEARFAWAQS